MARQPAQKKRHHFVPRLILRRFTDANGNFWLYRKKAPDLGIVSANINDDFFRTHFYSRISEDGSRDVSLEDWFSLREDLWGPLLDRIIPEFPNLCFHITKEVDRALIGELFYYQLVRTPEFLERVASIDDFERELARITEETEREFGRMLTDDQRRLVTGREAIKRIRQNTIVDNLLPGAKLRRPNLAEQLIREAPFQGATLGPAIPLFVVGSFPIVSIPSPAPVLDGGQRELWFPVASHCAVSPLLRTRSTRLAELSERRVRTINQAVFTQSDVIACVDRDVLQELVAVELEQQ